ncbi:MAG: hypothetical protein K2X87_08690 [Gemmataceae bacterium]|nr:hypothetical protein [Gemmataceae bacterium]
MTKRKLCVVLAMVGLVGGYCEWVQAQVVVPGTVTWATKNPAGQAQVYPIWTKQVPPAPLGSVTVWAEYKVNPGGFTLTTATLKIINGAGGPIQSQPLVFNSALIGAQGMGKNVDPATFNLPAGNYTVYIEAVFVDKKGVAQPPVSSPPSAGTI